MNLVYEMRGRGGFFKVKLLSKKERPRGDGIKLEWLAKGDKSPYFVCVKEWEAICIIEGLACALRERRKR